MDPKLTVIVINVLLHQWMLVESVENVNLSYHYKNEGAVFKPVCDNKDEYVILEGEEVVINVRKIEILKFARCTLQQNPSFVVTAHNFLNCGKSNLYRGKLKYVKNEPYNCSFYTLKEESKQFEPTAVFNNTAYVRISCIFKLKVYREQPILLTVNVNEETLIPSRKSIDNVIRSEYKYSEQQKITVTCKKHGPTNGTVQLTMPGIERQDADPNLSISKAGFQLNNPRVLGSYFTLRCYLHDGNDTLEVYNVDFAPKKPLNEIDVDGLSINNLIENKDDNKSLYYKYTDIEEVNLKCSMACLNEYCQMEMWYNDKKLNYTQWMYNLKVDVSHILVFTPADNSSIIKCIGFNKPATEVFVQTMRITLLHVNGETKEPVTVLRTDGPSNGENTTTTGVTSTNDLLKNRQYSRTTTFPSISKQPSTSPRFSNYLIWTTVSVFFVVVIVLFIMCLSYTRRRHRQKSQRPPIPLPESMELDILPSASQNQGQPDYEEIPDVMTHSVTAEKLLLRRIPDMRLDAQNGRLIVKGKAIDLQKLLSEAVYEEMK